jgi:flagellar basal-body rod protein FlgC
MAVSVSGMAAQRARAQLLVENLANSETTRTPEGGPYRRKDVVFSTAEPGASFSETLRGELDGGVGVEVSEVIQDQQEPLMRYIPGHPDANAQGYVAFPKINPAQDMVDLLGASQGYQANVSAMSAVKDMIHRSIDLLR